MSKKLRDNYNVRIKQPIDTRFQCNTTSEIDRTYEGLETYSTSVNKYQQYINGIWQDNPIYQALIDIASITTKHNNTDIANVKDFGAKGDGVTDDTQAFKDAIASRGTIGGIVQVPRGNYKITDTLDIQHSIRIIGQGWSMLDGTTILSFNLDSKATTYPAIKIHKTECVHIEGLYIINNGTTLRRGISIDGTNGGANNEMNSFVSIHNVLCNKFDINFFVGLTWIVSFRDCYAKAGSFGFYVAGGTITTTLFDHCYSESNTSRGYYVNGAYYTTFISCATDYAPIGYKISNCQSASMVGCGCEATINTAIDIDGSTVNIDGFTSVNNGTGSDNGFATTLNGVSSCINALGISEISIPSGTTKIASISLGSDVVGSYITSGKELLGIYFPKNGKFVYDGQKYTSGLPTATGWKASDIGKVVYEFAPIEAGTTPNKYIKIGYVRLTTGNGNVLNTDWKECRVLTGN